MYVSLVANLSSDYFIISRIDLTNYYVKMILFLKGHFMMKNHDFQYKSFKRIPRYGVIECISI